ncbi:hypothetical protein EDEG_04241, partial [Edhazardia aedis USNM 41457]
NKYFQICFMFKRKFAEEILKILEEQKKFTLNVLESINDANLLGDHVKTVFYREWDDKIIKSFNGLEMKYFPIFYPYGRQYRIVIFNRKNYRTEYDDDDVSGFLKSSNMNVPFHLCFFQDGENLKELRGSVMVIKEDECFKIYFYFRNRDELPKYHKIYIHKRIDIEEVFTDNETSVISEKTCYSISNEKFVKIQSLPSAFILNLISDFSYFCVNQQYIVQAIL